LSAGHPEARRQVRRDPFPSRLLVARGRRSAIRRRRW
jgi:hypothetical protein